MDVHMHNSRMLHYSLNDDPKHFSEDDLRFLSLEERECILFFEETIGSLEEDDERTGMLAVERPASHTQTARHHSPVDHEIIDLVHPTPNPNKRKDTLPITPDIQELIAAPESHNGAKRDPPAMLRVSDAPPKEVGHQPPAGSAIITNKIGEHEGITPASQLPQRRSVCVQSEFPQNPSVKHGPPTHAKPLHLPNSIGMLLGSRDNIPHSIATEAVSVQERRAHMLSNLSGSAHPLDGGEPSCVRNLPMRSISFRDLTPDKSRMEALSKLGLAQRLSQSIMHSSTTFKSNSPANASADVRATDTTDHCHTRSSPAPILTSAEVTHSDFNSYGGKSIKLNPSMSFKAEHVSTSLPKEASEVHVNNFGGRLRAMSTPGPNHGARSKTFFPVKEDRTAKEDLPKRKASQSEAPASRSNAQPPTPAPRAQRHPSPLSPTGSRPPQKSSFRAQGITVQFSGRGATDEARRNALRKLGLLRDTS